jgi:hypothetical protein
LFGIFIEASAKGLKTTPPLAGELKTRKCFVGASGLQVIVLLTCIAPSLTLPRKRGRGLKGMPFF